MQSNTDQEHQVSEVEQRIAEIRERLTAATPVTARNLMAYDHGGGRLYVETPKRDLIADFYDQANRDFYTCAYADVSLLLEQLASVPAQIEAARAEEREACVNAALATVGADCSCITDAEVEDCMRGPSPRCVAYNRGCERVAAAIRSRGVTK